MTAETEKRSYARFTEPMNFFDEPKVKERVDKIAARENLSRSDVLRELVAAALPEREEQSEALGQATA